MVFAGSSRHCSSDKKVWRDVLIASLVIQLLALGTPLFTQTIIDKVVVHHTQSTLIVIAIGMAIFMIFSAILSWVRQYMVLHTGNRVDAVLAAEVFDHLFKLPPRYFEMRPTGVIAARLQGVETIRDVYRQCRCHADSGSAVPVYLCRYHVLLQRSAHPDRAGDSCGDSRYQFSL